MPQADYIYVRSGRSDNRVALSEVDEAHPGGTAFVAQGMTRKVGYTPFVADQIRQGFLVEVNDAAGKKQADEFAKTVMSGEEREAMGEPQADTFDPLVGKSDSELAQMAKDRNIKIEQGMRKSDLVSAIAAHDNAEAAKNESLRNQRDEIAAEQEEKQDTKTTKVTAPGKDR